jgi:hypothetical protein
MNVSDRVAGDTIIKQKATFVSLSHTQNTSGSYASIQVLVEMYANAAGAYGDKLSGPGIGTYHVTMNAANDTIVNAETGTILHVRSGESEGAWQALAELSPQPVMFQGDFFEMLREQPVKIADLIRSHIANADALGRFSM